MTSARQGLCVRLSRPAFVPVCRCQDFAGGGKPHQIWPLSHCQDSTQNRWDILPTRCFNFPSRRPIPKDRREGPREAAPKSGAERRLLRGQRKPSSGDPGSVFERGAAFGSVRAEQGRRGAGSPWFDLFSGRRGERGSRGRSARSRGAFSGGSGRGGTAGLARHAVD
jgi:hypothetical protein